MDDDSRVTGNTAGGKNNAAEAARIREAAVALHDLQAPMFERKYDEMRTDYFASSFAYGRKRLDTILDRVIGDLPPGSRILDVGCGTGEQIRHYRERGFDVAGIEPASKMRALAQRANPESTILPGSILEIPFPDRSFDLVMAIEVLRYLDRDAITRAEAEMLRVVRPGGIAVFTMINRYALDGFYLLDRVRRAGAALLGKGDLTHHEFVTPEEVREDLERLGGREIQFQGCMLAPLRLAYKVSPAIGAPIARLAEKLEGPIGEAGWHTRFAGHLVVIVKRGDD